MFSKRSRILILLFYLFIVAGSFLAIFNLYFDFNFEAFFPRTDSDLQYYLTYRENFEPDDNHILVAIHREEGINDSAFLKQVDHFTKEAAKLPFVKQSHSLTNLSRPKIIAGFFSTVPYIHINNLSGTWKTDSLRIATDPAIKGRFISNDGKAIIVIIKTSFTLGPKESESFDKALNTLISKYTFTEYHIAGRAHYQVEFVKEEKFEFFLYSGLASLLIIFMMSIIFRKIWGVLIAVASVLTGMIIFMGYLGITHTVLNPMATLFPILMIIVGLSDVIHIMSKYTEELHRGKLPIPAIKFTLKEIGLAMFLTSLTTAVGFISLLSSNIPPIRSFGVMSAIGVFLAFLTVILLTPTLLIFFKRAQIIRDNNTGQRWHHIFEWIYRITLTHKSLIIGISSLIVCISLFGLLKISGNIHLANSFPKTKKVYSDFKYFEAHMGGIKAFEMSIEPKNNYTIDDYEVLKQVDSLESFLEQSGGMFSVMSPAIMYRSMNRGLHNDNPRYFRFPDNQTDFNLCQRYLSKAPMSKLNVLISRDKKFGRITAQIHDEGSIEGFRLRKEVTSWINANLDTTIVTYRQTGIAMLLDKNGVNVRYNMFRGLGIAFIIISLIMGLLFRNINMILISLIPNVIPILIGGGIIGFFGVELDAPTAIIFAIAFGIAIDDTIHFLSRFRLEIGKGLSNEEAIRVTFHETGKAITLTSIILLFGFSILITSAYPPTHVIGLLLSITLTSALIADLFLTPVLIYLFFGAKKKMKKN